MDMTNYLKLNWQDQHAEQYTDGLLAKSDYTGLSDALLIHSSERVRRAALKTLNQLDFAMADDQIVDLMYRSVKAGLLKLPKIYASDFVDAASVLGKIKRPEGIGYLISLLEKEDYLKCEMKVQNAFSACCGAIGEPGIDVLLAHLLEHHDCRIEREVVSGFGAIGGERAYEALVSGLQHYCKKDFGYIWEWMTVDSYVYYLERIGLKPATLTPLRAALDLVTSKYAEKIARTDRVLLGEPQEPKLIKKIEALILKIESETK